MIDFDKIKPILRDMGIYFQLKVAKVIKHPCLEALQTTQDGPIKGTVVFNRNKRYI